MLTDFRGGSGSEAQKQDDGGREIGVSSVRPHLIPYDLILLGVVSR